jgi:hypothetical protein
MQFKVPQNVQREDKIVGPLTLRQLIMCGVGGGIAYAIYVSLGREFIWITWFPPVAIIVLITILFAFVRPLDMDFSRFLAVYLEFILLPQKRFWVQSSAEIVTSMYTSLKPQTKVEAKAEAKAEQMLDKKKKLEELSKILNTHSNNLQQ